MTAFTRPTAVCNTTTKVTPEDTRIKTLVTGHYFFDKKNPANPQKVGDKEEAGKWFGKEQTVKVPQVEGYDPDFVKTNFVVCVPGHKTA